MVCDFIKYRVLWLLQQLICNPHILHLPPDGGHHLVTQTNSVIIRRFLDYVFNIIPVSICL
jgi:hypothetical protein